MGTPINPVDQIPAGAVLGVDTAPFIYYVEGHSEFGNTARLVFDACIRSGRNPAVTSVITLAEVLVGAFRADSPETARQYRAILSASRHLTLVPILPAVAELAADLRVRFQLRLPDAMQIAAAQVYGATYFVTNDEYLRCCTTIRVVTLRQFV